MGCLHLALFLPDRWHDLLAFHRLQRITKAWSHQKACMVHRQCFSRHWIWTVRPCGLVLRSIRALQSHQERLYPQDL